MSGPKDRGPLYYYGSRAWFAGAVDEAVQAIGNSGVVFDTFAVRGVSGIVFGAKLAHVMDKNLAVVRKPGESSHGGSVVEGYRVDRYIFVDDFVSSGDTRDAVKDGIRQRYPSAVMVGQYLYQETGAAARFRIYYDYAKAVA